MTEVEQFFLTQCTKFITNKLPVTDTGYKHPDLWKINEKAKAEGRKVFYYKPLDPNNKYGQLVECDPVYEYRCDIKMSEEDFKKLLQKVEGDL